MRGQIVVSPGTAHAVKLLLAAEGVDFDAIMSVYRKSLDQEPGNENIRWLTLEEAMSFARVSRATISRWSHGGQLKTLKLSPEARCGKVLVSNASLEALLASKCVSDDGRDEGVLN